jgi:hypothetical protein
MANGSNYYIRIFRILTDNSPDWLKNGIRLAAAPNDVTTHNFYMVIKSSAPADKQAAKFFIDNTVICPPKFKAYRFRPGHRQ